MHFLCTLRNMLQLSHVTHKLFHNLLTYLLFLRYYMYSTRDNKQTNDNRPKISQFNVVRIELFAELLSQQTTCIRVVTYNKNGI